MCSFLFCEFCLWLLWIRQRSTCSWKCDVGRRGRRCIFLWCFIAETDWKGSSWIFFPKLFRNLAWVQLFHKLLVIRIIVILEFTILNDKTILIQSNFTYISIFLLLLFGKLIRWSFLMQIYFVFFYALSIKDATSGLITAIPLLYPPVYDSVVFFFLSSSPPFSEYNQLYISSCRLVFSGSFENILNI